MYKKILIPVDMSHTQKAHEMIAVARKLGDADTSYILMNVVYSIPSYTPVDLSSDYFKIAADEAEEKLQEIAKAEDLKAEVEVIVGDAHNKILDCASSKGADIIIIGSHRPGFADYLLGSTASRVVRHAKCPVLVLR